MSPTYSKPPIVEAILDIQVELPSRVQAKHLLKCQNPVRKDYPEKKSTQLYTALFQFGPVVSTSATTRPAGFAFESVDRKQMFQVRRDGFTFNRLAPYSGWDSFVREAKRLWEEFVRVAHPTEIKRVALRYINRLDFPHESINMSTYFDTHPTIGEGLPQTMRNFFFQLQVPIPEIDSLAIITETAVEPRAPKSVSIILDIDLFRTDKLPAQNDLWPLFETLRTWKNTVFERSITDATRALIQ
jgi:uncharacterized protein (TIGR04255 family)